jgi:hypothetical protein
MKVQHWLDGGEDTPDHEYETVVCKACTRLHFINRRTGRLLGQTEEKELSVGGLGSRLSASEKHRRLDLSRTANAQRKHFRLR